jgi:predicted nucleic acid-binding protein
VADRTFVDTNILVYADDADAGSKQKRAESVLVALIASGDAVISTQVLQEYFNAATRKLGHTPERARKRVVAFAKLDVVLIRPEIVLEAIDLHRMHQMSIWDALILRCAAVAGCSRVLSEDMQHGQIVDGVRIENPFAGK